MPDTSFCIDFAAQPVGRSSPDTSNGFVDWETMFEHPDTGLLTCVIRAQTPETLRTAMTGIISEIYMRQNDGAEKARLMNWFERMIADVMDASRLQIIIEAILSKFRKIKDYRKSRQRSVTRP